MKITPVIATELSWLNDTCLQMHDLSLAWGRVLSIKRSIADLAMNPSNESFIQALCKTYSIAPNRNIIAIYEDFSQQLKNIKDKIVALIKQFVTKMKDIAFNLCNKVNIDKVIQTINVNKTKVSAAAEAVKANPTKTGNLTNVLKGYSQGKQSFNIVGEQGTILTNWLTDLSTQANEIKNEVMARKTSLDKAKTSAPAPGAAMPENSNANQEPESPFDSQCNQIPPGGEWSSEQLVNVHGVYEAMIPNLNNLVIYSNALENAAKDVSNVVSSLSTDDKDKGQMKQATDLVKYIKDKLVLGNKCISKISTNVNTIGTIADTISNALK